MRMLACLAILTLCGGCLRGQAANAVSPGAKLPRSTPRLPDGKPDFTGIWIGGGPLADLAAGLPDGEKIPLLPEAEKLMSQRLAKDDPEANCLPTGVPRIAPYPWTFATA